LAINRVSGFKFQVSSNSLLTPKTLTVLGVVLGAGMLLYFKYLNFFVEQFAALFALMGLKTNFSSFHILVPIGISFFTFKLISYVVEVYKGNMEPCRDFVTFAAYIAFFPTIMSGPIDSPKMFIPQMAKARRWNNSAVTEGMIRVLWGMFLKMCIADKVSPYTDAVFNNYGHHSGVTIAVAAVMYTFQIYTDFCGYSEMAIGTAQVMGFRVTENFMRPYFSTNVGEFWRRWHASLMNWFRDYIYFPLGGSRCSKAKMYRNTMVVFLVSGLWHGANWTFIFWGAYHGLLVCFYKLIKPLVPGFRIIRETHQQDSQVPDSAKPDSPKSESHLEKHETWNLIFETIRKYTNILLVFILVTIGWMVFRCDSFGQFWGMLAGLTAPGHFFASWALTAVLPIGIMLLKELKDEEGWNIHLLHSDNWVVKAMSVGLLIVFILYMGELEGAKFIYFQF
jgi:D-alanyl-lipoteichoic acid acyltransferase DltB (MBOAT superfamily)